MFPRVIQAELRLASREEGHQLRVGAMLPALQELQLRELSARQLADMFAAPQPARLQWLAVTVRHHDSGFGAAGWAAVAKLPALTSLHVDCDVVPWVEAPRAWASLAARLTCLEVIIYDEDSSLGEWGTFMDALAKGGTLRQLHLMRPWQRVAWDMGPLVRGLAACPRLTHVWLGCRDCVCTPRALAALVASPSLQHLHLDEYNDADALAEARQHARAGLHVTGCWFDARYAGWDVCWT